MLFRSLRLPRNHLNDTVKSHKLIQASRSSIESSEFELSRWSSSILAQVYAISQSEATTPSRGESSHNISCHCPFCRPFPELAGAHHNKLTLRIL